MLLGRKKLQRTCCSRGGVGAFAAARVCCLPHYLAHEGAALAGSGTARQWYNPTPRSPHHADPYLLSYRTHANDQPTCSGSHVHPCFQTPSFYTVEFGKAMLNCCGCRRAYTRKLHSQAMRQRCFRPQCRGQLPCWSGRSQCLGWCGNRSPYARQQDFIFPKGVFLLGVVGVLQGAGGSILWTGLEVQVAMPRHAQTEAQSVVSSCFHNAQISMPFSRKGAQNSWKF